MKLSEELRWPLRAASSCGTGAAIMKSGRSLKTGALLVVDDDMKSKHIANRVLRAAGLPKAF